jgi:hypothetical protein
MVLYLPATPLAKNGIRPKRISWHTLPPGVAMTTGAGCVGATL